MNPITRISTLEQILSIINNVRELVVYIVSLSSTILSVILMAQAEPLWSSVFSAIAIAGIAVLMIVIRKEEKSSVCVNPNLIIEQDILMIFVARNCRKIEQRLTLRARRRISSYEFKFFWTGSSRGLKIQYHNGAGYLSRVETPSDATLQWRLYRFEFHEPVEKGRSKSVTFRYKLPDPKNVAKPYHYVSYAHVKACKHLEYRVVFAKGYKPKAVRLVRFDARGVPLDRKRIEPGLREYHVEVEPQSGHKYSLEWEHDK